MHTIEIDAVKVSNLENTFKKVLKSRENQSPQQVNLILGKQVAKLSEFIAGLYQYKSITSLRVEHCLCQQLFTILENLPPQITTLKLMHLDEVLNKKEKQKLVNILTKSRTKRELHIAVWAIDENDKVESDDDKELLEYLKREENEFSKYWNVKELAKWSDSTSELKSDVAVVSTSVPLPPASIAPAALPAQPTTVAATTSVAAMPPPPAPLLPPSVVPPPITQPTNASNINALLAAIEISEFEYRCVRSARAIRPVAKPNHRFSILPAASAALPPMPLPPPPPSVQPEQSYDSFLEPQYHSTVNARAIRPINKRKDTGGKPEIIHIKKRAAQSAALFQPAEPKRSKISATGNNSSTILRL